MKRIENVKLFKSCNMDSRNAMWSVQMNKSVQGSYFSLLGKRIISSQSLGKICIYFPIKFINEVIKLMAR